MDMDLTKDLGTNGEFVVSVAIVVVVFIAILVLVVVVVFIPVFIPAFIAVAVAVVILVFTASVFAVAFAVVFIIPIVKNVRRRGQCRVEAVRKWDGDVDLQDTGRGGLNLEGAGP